jgi:hypothetical protein
MEFLRALTALWHALFMLAQCLGHLLDRLGR